MKLQILKMTIDNFKGVKHKEVSFDGDTEICGQNGTGKSTCADAIFWTFADCNTALVKNPNITPLGAEECVSSVELELSIDGKPLSVKKAQKFKRKTDNDGKITSAIVNSYEINSVEKKLKDYVADLNERGIDTDRILVFTHPNFFLADTSKKGRETIRELLFDMAEPVTNEEIATEINAPELLAEMNKGYKLDEIEARSKSTLRKIVESMGKDNTIINARIDSLLSSKAEGDIDELKAEKEKIQVEITKIDNTLNGLIDTTAETNRKISRLQSEIDELNNKANEELRKKKSELDVEKSNLQNEKNIKVADANAEKRIVESIENELSTLDEELCRYRDLYKQAQNEVLDEDDLHCPTCGAEYPAERADEIKEQFEESKNERLNAYKTKGESTKKLITSKKEEKEYHINKIDAIEKDLEKVEDSLAKVNKERDKLPARIDISETDEYKALASEISALNESIRTNTPNTEMMAKKRELQATADEITEQIGVLNRNADIDTQVEKLRQDRAKAEINKSQAEKIIHQLEQFNKHKIERLTESINNKFSLVSWRLWDLQKNGNYIETCEPLIDGKPMTACANGSLQTLAKISICSDIQRANNVSYPIICDDYSLCSSNTTKRINFDSQFIGLVVTEDKALKTRKIEKGDK